MDKQKLEELLHSIVRTGASTLHLVAGQAPCVRLQGNLMRSTEPPLTAQDLQELTRDFLFADHRKELAEGHEVEVLYSSRSGIRFRTTVMEQATGLSLAMRRVPSEVPTLAELGMPDLVGGFTTFRCGLVLVAGFVGSGKTTTVAAMVEKLNQEPNHHIVTIEDPIERLYRPGASLLHQRELGAHVSSYQEGIDDAVRSGASVVVVGSIEDAATLSAVLDACEAGLLVLSTCHGSNIVSGLTGLLARCAPAERGRIRYRLANALKVMLAQTLLQKSHGGGKVPLVEILINNSQVNEALRAEAFQALPGIMQKCRGLGMQTVDLALKSLLSRNQITLDEALYHAVDRDWIGSRPTASAAVPKHS